MTHRFTDLRRRYLSLGLGELAAAAIFAVMAAINPIAAVSTDDDRLALWSALTPLLFVLVQAGVYWLLARSWLSSGSMPAGLALVYRGLRILDPLVLTAGLMGLVLNFPSSTTAAVLVCAVWVFAVIEYLNYFVVRLSYPIAHWASSIGRRRTPRLVKDLRTAESRTRDSGAPV